MRTLPPTGINLFQLIYVLMREYTAKSGLSPLNLSLGNPDTIPPNEILSLQSKYASQPDFELHTYAEDNNLNNFAEGMIYLHGNIEVKDYPHLAAQVIPGIKGASTLLPLSCAAHSRDFKMISNLPAYDIIGTWCEAYFKLERVVWPLQTADNMRLNMATLRTLLEKHPGEIRLIHVIRPGNPAAVGASKEEWQELIEICILNNIRLVNDGAYCGLVGDDKASNHVPLAEVACNFPELEWLEAYSVSKSFSDPGARLGALVGSKDFIEDFVVIKGNTDSGPVPSIMAAYGEFLSDRKVAKEALRSLSSLYQKRLQYLIPKLEECGFKAACATEAGFFTLWRVPNRVLGKSVSQYASENGYPIHEAFNRLVIAETGLTGVHFMGVDVSLTPQPLIRYAVCTDVLSSSFQERFEEALARLKLEY
jgi:aspartate/methionine/tyrosine aminotransferase